MTVLLVLFFISIALLADYWQEKKRVYVSNKARAPARQVIYYHDNGLLPTMADGGTEDPPKTQ
jgi:hypothetical protein